MSQVFPQGSQSAYTRYVNALSDAIKNRDWVYDPSFALQSDRQIYEKILRDPVAAHAIRFRKHLVAAAEVRVVSASERPEDEAPRRRGCGEDLRGPAAEDQRLYRRADLSRECDLSGILLRQDHGL